MPDFTELPVYSGVGPYHFNRYRVVFERPGGLSAATLAMDFTANFPLYLNSKFATVEWGSRHFNAKPTLKFHGYMRVLGIDIARPHHDWVVREWYDPNVGFTAQTLKREFFEAGADIPAAAGGAMPGVLMTPTALAAALAATEAVVGAAAAVHYNRMHFLAGRRSWRLGDGNVFGVSGDVLVLETIAVERFSAQMYNVADRLLHMEKLIPDIWIANLSNFIYMRGLTPVKQQHPLSPQWQNRGPVDFLVRSFGDLNALSAYIEFQDAFGLFPTILP